MTRENHARPARLALPARRLGHLLMGVTLTIGGCARPAAESSDVVVYTSIDQPFAERILARFQQKTGIRAVAVFDTEAGKTTGFLRRLEREAANPRCDVWWSSEVFGSIELARAGVLRAFANPAAADIPSEWKDSQNRWVGLAARARVLAYHRERAPRDSLPDSWRGFLEGDWPGRLAIANPYFGTTRGHVAALFADWGEVDARRLLERLRQRRETRFFLADGNAHAVRMLAAGQADLCWTDTDDVLAAQRRGEPIEMIFPGSRPNEPATWIPCSVGVVAGGPHPRAAEQLAEFLAEAETERLLFESDSHNVPLRAPLRAELNYAGPAPVALDFERAADALPNAMQAVGDILID